MDKIVLYVDRGAARPDDLQESIEEILAESTSGESELTEEASALGLTSENKPTIAVEETAQGFEPLSTLAIVFVGAVGKELARRLWVEVIRPEIKRRRGADAVGELKDDNDD
jgi:hypothetical protein